MACPEDCTNSGQAENACIACYGCVYLSPFAPDTRSLHAEDTVLAIAAMSLPYIPATSVLILEFNPILGLSIDQQLDPPLTQFFQFGLVFKQTLF